MYFSWLADFLPAPSINRPRTLSLTPSCSTWTYPVASAAAKSAGWRLDGPHTTAHSAQRFDLSGAFTTKPPYIISAYPFWILPFFDVKFKFDDVHANTITCSAWTRLAGPLRSNQFGCMACGLQRGLGTHSFPDMFIWLIYFSPVQVAVPLSLFFRGK